MKSILKRTLVIMLVLVMVAGVVACGTKSSTTSDKSEPAKATETKVETQKQPVTISFQLPASWIEMGGLKDLINKYQQKSGNIIEVQAVQDNQATQLLMTKLATGDCYDVFWRYTAGEALIVSPDKNCVDLTNEPWVSRIEPGILDMYIKLNGKVYACPLGGSSVIGVVYNKQIFADLNLSIPKTLNELESVCETIKTKGNGIIPIYLPCKDGWTVAMNYCAEFPNIIAANPDIMEKLNTNQIQWKDVPGFIDIFERVEKYNKKGYFMKDPATATYEMEIQAIANGTAAMCWQGDWFASEVLKRKADAQIGMFPMPTEKGEGYIDVGAPAGMYIYNKSQNISTAKEFLAFLAEPENLNYYFEKRPDLPVFKDVKVEKLNPLASDAMKYIEQGKGGAHFTSLLRIPLPESAIFGLYPELLYGRITPEQLVKIWGDEMVKSGKNKQMPGF